MSRSQFKEFQSLTERCLTALSEEELQPRNLWFKEDAESLEGVKRALRRVVHALETGLGNLAHRQDDRFGAVTALDEWTAITEEIPEWQRLFESLRPAADAEHVKVRLMSTRTRLSELLEKLAVRGALRDPYRRFANSLEVEKSIPGLAEERRQRELGLGLLIVSWKETLAGGVADWSMSFGPAHRIELDHFCCKLLGCLEAIEAMQGRAPSVETIAKLGGEITERLAKMQGRLAEIPVDKVDAGVASDFAYMASLAKKIADGVADQHGAVVREHAGRELPPPVADLFHLLNLSVPRLRRRTRTLTRTLSGTRTQTMTHEELEAQIGRRLWDTPTPKD